MFEGALLGIAVLVVLGALLGLLNRLLDHGRAVVSALIVIPILLWIWWQEWFGNVFVFGLMAILLLSVATLLPEALIRLRNRRTAATRDGGGESRSVIDASAADSLPDHRGGPGGRAVAGPDDVLVGAHEDQPRFVGFAPIVAVAHDLQRHAQRLRRRLECRDGRVVGVEREQA